jgi:hypothetical protein
MMDIEFDINKEKAIKTIVKFQNGRYITPAIRELIQNGIDAGATFISVSIHRDYIEIRDNGRGMTKEEILEKFRVLFETEKNNEDIGQFGIGRTQIMNFGKCIWLTKNYSMYVNLKEFVGFKLNERKQLYNGTRVICVLKDPIDAWDVRYVSSQVKSLVLPFNFIFEVNGTTVR